MKQIIFLLTFCTMITSIAEGQDTINNYIRGNCIDTGKLVNNGCPQGIFFKFDYSENLLYIYGTITANCCGQHLAYIQRINDTINVTISDTGSLCKCECNYCFNITTSASINDTIINFNNTLYNIKTGNKLSDTNTYTVNHITSACLNNNKSASEECPKGINFTMQNDTLQVFGIIEANCCGENFVKVKKLNDSIFIRTSHWGDLCDCLCEFCFSIKVPVSANDTIVKINYDTYNIKKYFTHIKNQQKDILTDLSTYPNPYTNELIIEGKSSKPTLLKINIYNIMGLKMYESDFIAVNPGIIRHTIPANSMVNTSTISILKVDVGENTYSKIILKK